MSRYKVVCALTLALLAGCSPAVSAPVVPPASTGHRVAGSVTIKGSSILVVGTACSGGGGYADMDRGTTVTVKDQAGTIIATGLLDAGVYDNSNAMWKLCRFGFAVPAVPDAPFYSLEVGHRGALTYSRADLDALGWTVALTLGG